MKIIPSIIAKNQKEFNQRYNKIKDISKLLHLDVMDGKFVKNKSLMFDFKVKKINNYSAHLMTKNSLPWLKKNLKKVSRVALHYESKDLDRSIEFVKSKKKKVGIAINPRTKVSKIKDYLPKVNYVLVMTVNPGKYGSKFLPDNLKKVKKINKPVVLDGSINDKTIKQAKKSGADSVVVGSYIQKSENSKQAILNLKKLIR